MFKTMNAIQFFDWGYSNKGVVLKINNLSVDLQDFEYITLLINKEGTQFPCTFAKNGEEGLRFKVIEQNTYGFFIDKNADDFYKQLYNELLIGGFAGFKLTINNVTKTSIIENRWLKNYSMIDGYTNELRVGKLRDTVDDIKGNIINLNFEQLPNVFPHRQSNNQIGYVVMQNNINQQYIWDFKFCNKMTMYFVNSGWQSVNVTAVQLDNFWTVFNFNLTAIEMHEWLRYYDKHIEYIEFSSDRVINSGQVFDKNSTNSRLNNNLLDSSLIQYHLDNKYIRFNFMKQNEQTKLSTWMLDNYFLLYVSNA
jgi:hypothetical protein